MHYETDFVVKDTLEKKLHHDRWTRSWAISYLCKPTQQVSRSNFLKSTLVLDCVHFGSKYF